MRVGLRVLGAVGFRDVPAVLGVLTVAAAFGMAEQWAGAQWAGQFGRAFR
jgi:hypothetical protein